MDDSIIGGREGGMFANWTEEKKRGEGSVSINLGNNVHM